MGKSKPEFKIPIDWPYEEWVRQLIELEVEGRKLKTRKEKLARRKPCQPVASAKRSS